MLVEMTARKPTADYFSSAQKTLSWAEEGIEELNGECIAFFNDRPFRKVIEFDAEAGQNIVKITAIKPLPDKIVRLATEAINNIKHSFDQSTFAAVIALGKGTTGDFHFIWTTTRPKDFEGRLRSGRKGLPPELWPIFCEFKPYATGETNARGDNLVRELARIANRKHRVALTFAPAVQGGMWPSVTGFMKAGTRSSLPIPIWDSVKNEVIIARVPRGLKVHNDTRLAFNVAFDEPPPLKGRSAVGLLDLFLAKAKSVADRLEREVTTIRGV